MKLIFLKELYWIKDNDLMSEVGKVWLRAADIGGWKNLDDVPFTLLFENSGYLTDHTKRVKILQNALWIREMSI